MKEYKVCAVCFSGSPNCLGECVCSYGGGPIISLTEEQLDAIYLLRKNFNIELKKDKLEKVYFIKD